MKGKRQSTVEPVLGTLTQFMGLRKINNIGIGQANKAMHLAAIAYNIKKYLKYTQKRVKSESGLFALLLKQGTPFTEAFTAILEGFISVAHKRSTTKKRLYCCLNHGVFHDLEACATLTIVIGGSF